MSLLPCVRVAATLGALLLPLSAASTRALAQAPDDSAAAAATVERFRSALATGDSAAALSLLADDAVILESGGVESRSEYRAHHLPADIEFARAVRSTRVPMRVTVRGDVAWVSSSSIAEGQFRGRAVNSASAELMVLTREPDGWKIRAIHWSSRNRRPSQ
jgi:ketosteroid isomerase-like protein